MINLTDQNFEQEILQYKGVALVDFHATWCGPCQMQGPIVDDLAKEIGDKAKIVKVDVDQAPKTSEMFGIMSVPTLIIFKDGKAVETMTGLQNKESLRKKIEALL